MNMEKKPFLSKSGFSKKGQATNGGIAMALAMILTWVLGESGVTVPAEITAASSVVIGWLFARFGT
jgi:hypothetical protein